MGENWEKFKKWSKNEKWYRKSIFKQPGLYGLSFFLAYWNVYYYDTGTFFDFVFNFIVFFLILGGIFYSIKKSLISGENREKAERKIYRKLDKLLEAHIDTLVAKRSKYLYKDPYGSDVYHDWVEKGIMYFINTQLRPHLSAYEKDRLEIEMDQVIEVIDEAVRSKTRRVRVQIDFSETMDRIEYEQLCKEILEKLGWKVGRTREDLKEGVDLVASKKDLEISLQCRKQSRPVGMNAVKEIIAGKAFHNTPYGVVVTSRSFSDAAKKLASQHGIFLLHHKNLTRLEGMIRRRGRLPTGGKMPADSSAR